MKSKLLVTKRGRLLSRNGSKSHGPQLHRRRFSYQELRLQVALYRWVARQFGDLLGRHFNWSIAEMQRFLDILCPFIEFPNQKPVIGLRNSHSTFSDERLLDKARVPLLQDTSWFDRYFPARCLYLFFLFSTSGRTLHQKMLSWFIWWKIRMKRQWLISKTFATSMAWNHCYTNSTPGFFRFLCSPSMDLRERSAQLWRSCGSGHNFLAWSVHSSVLNWKTNTFL